MEAPFTPISRKRRSQPFLAGAVFTHRIFVKLVNLGLPLTRDRISIQFDHFQSINLLRSFYIGAILHLNPLLVVF
jgi:hypothetical protein